MTPEQPNTPELMGEYLIKRHRPYAESYQQDHRDTIGSGFAYRKLTEDRNATQSAIVSAEVALESQIKVRDTFVHNTSITVSKTVADEITFWEQTIKYLKSKL